MFNTKDFAPNYSIRNAHLQSILPSLFTAFFLSRKDKKVLSSSQKRLSLNTKDYGILEAFLHQSPKPNKKQEIVILLHGWEGCSRSGYMQRSAIALLKQGYDVLKLNFRDHGDNHHLNAEPFNSARLIEVKQAIELVLRRCHYTNFHLIGFSLGGNFALRLCAEHDSQFRPKSFISICPPIDPIQTSWDIEHGLFIYHKYFVKRWHRSLKQKYRYFPELMRSHQDLYKNQQLTQKPSLNDMNQIFVPMHTDYDEVDHYFDAYAIDQSILERIEAEGLIIYSQDDPVINAKHFARLCETQYVKIKPQRYGGHCGFINNFTFENWLDEIIVDFIQQHQ